MNLSKLTKRNRFYILCLLTTMLAASCTRSEPPEVSLPPIPVVPTPAQPVEYGASLSEWEEATQAENSDNIDVGETLEPTGYPVPPQITPSIEPEIVVTEAVQSEGSYPGLEATTTAPEVTVDNATPEAQDTPTIFILNDTVYQEIMWEALVPADFTADAIMAKYADQLSQITDGSSEGIDLYAQMQAEFNNAPVNESMDGVLVRLPGFIAPLEYTDDLITEFLLVPYFGACIHVPPPPANQTVLVKLEEGQGIKFEDAWFPFWVMGELTAEGTTTELAQAGYYVENAIIEIYNSDSP